ncbi:TetR/AcrR family transcriptional regulator [Symbioplanes lichenis]|uniref:TetR/AcrR family transcriptional regulator n=1 Tax=Symbioplanes lichenis TaxID=1629072 RepID=UPI0027385944|nr:TetR/AcrR family transcriptional regulator [Actinoplanes lichenis]
MTTPAPGRRERKKAATRQAIADAALELFLAHGYEKVGIRDVAEAADVSTTTLFKHFSGKEALVFDREEDREAQLVAAVRDRRPGQGILDALREHVRAGWTATSGHPRAAEFFALIDATPALRDHGERMWTRHTAALGAAIAAEAGAPPGDLSCLALARFVLDIPALTRGRPDLGAAIDEIFTVLEHGWHPPERTRS